jgi:ADP-ribose pyrophosphatase YjhB (NUDIX family)
MNQILSNIKNSRKAVQVVLLNEENQVLAVSRKDNHSDFGLVGGAVEKTDKSIEDAIIRECKEETGLDIYDLQLIFAIHKYGRMQYTFIAKHKGEINFNKDVETHIVKWADYELVEKGSFGEFNVLVRESLEGFGIKLK